MPSVDSPEKRNGAAHGKKVISPSAFAHAVFRTRNFESMVTFWTTFLGAEIAYKNDTICFMSYDEEHHRIALINVPELADRVPMANGLDHVAFSFSTLRDLADAYLQRKELGIVPRRSINHGPTTSLYYSDPDGNGIETQVDNFDSVEETIAFMSGPEFAVNPIGTDFDPEELVERLERGEDEKSIKKRVEIGPRGIGARH